MCSTSAINRLQNERSWLERCKINIRIEFRWCWSAVRIYLYEKCCNSGVIRIMVPFNFKVRHLNQKVRQVLHLKPDISLTYQCDKSILSPSRII